MNNTMNIDEGDDLRLAEYVLGVLDADERAAVEQRVESDPMYAQHLPEWQERLAPMLAEISDVVPPEFIWARIREEIQLRSAPTQAPQAAQQPGTLWSSLLLWRWLTASSLAATLVLSALLWNNLAQEPVADSLIAVSLHLENGQTAFTVALDANRETMIVIPVADVDLNGRVAQLWLIAGNAQPLSLGLLSDARPTAVRVPADMRALAEAANVFAISLEPAGGSPTGLPTGPVVAQGALTEI
tara:strand:+ start:62260 stop:62988 length:729 start_codon:yes stop_codon:yes gene_type:complete